MVVGYKRVGVRVLRWVWGQATHSGAAPLPATPAPRVGPDSGPPPRSPRRPCRGFPRTRLPASRQSAASSARLTPGRRHRLDALACGRRGGVDPAARSATGNSPPPRPRGRARDASGGSLGSERERAFDHEAIELAAVADVLGREVVVALPDVFGLEQDVAGREPARRERERRPRRRGRPSSPGRPPARRRVRPRRRCSARRRRPAPAGGSGTRPRRRPAATRGRRPRPRCPCGPSSARTIPNSSSPGTARTG